MAASKSSSRRFNLARSCSTTPPDDIGVDPEVVVDEDMSHPDDLRPRHFWRPCPDGLRESASDFADDLEMADDPALDQLICFECLAAASRVALDAADGF